MDREVLVSQLRRLERELRRQHGSVALLMLVPLESWPEEAWTLVVSAKGFNRITRAEGIRQLIALLEQVVDRELWSRIFRVAPLRTDDPFVAGMISQHPTRSVVDLHALHVEDFEIPKAVVFTAKKVAA
jgi:hypothetical protein